MLACHDSWSSAVCAYVVENEWCDLTEWKTETMWMEWNPMENCKKTCGHCGKNPTDKYDLCFIVRQYQFIYPYSHQMKYHSFHYVSSNKLQDYRKQILPLEWRK